MLKKTLTLMLTAVMLFSGCSNSSGAGETTTESVAAPSEAWDYEMYVEDLDYYMEQYIENFDSAKNAFAVQDGAAVRDYLENVLEALSSLEGVIYPPELEEVHGELLYAVGLERERSECNMEITYYMEISDKLTPEDYNALDNLNNTKKSLLKKIEENGDIHEKWVDAKNAAFSYLPNGEYRAYNASLEFLWDKYVTEVDELYDVFFNGAEGDALAICENCLEALSAFETMEVPEQVKPYHDDIIEALSTERNYCLAIKAIRETNNEYAGLAFEDLPADVQAKVEEYTETINDFLSDETKFDAMYNAVIAASEFALAQAGQ